MAMKCVLVLLDAPFKIPSKRVQTHAGMTIKYIYINDVERTHRFAERRHVVRIKKKKV